MQIEDELTAGMHAHNTRQQVCLPEEGRVTMAFEYA
jgi:hypothetical protein